jgi:glycosyltransferase involved in cell wall biosynthesis
VVHSLNTGGQSRIYPKGLGDAFISIPLVGKLPGPLRYILEVIVSFFYLLARRFKVPLVVVAVDPLSCFPAALLRKLFRIKLIFITPDFAHRRFANPALNAAYMWVDKFCTLNAEVNLCWSKTVQEYKHKLYQSDSHRGNIISYPYVPAPWVREKFKNIPKVAQRLVYAGTISSQINFRELFDSFASLQKQFPKMSLVLAGDGEERKALQDYAAQMRYINIRFTGSIDYYETLREIAQAEIGVALYSGGFDYDEFRDSFKIREYQALGAIPLATAVVKANAREIRQYGSGIIIDGSIGSIREAISNLLSSPYDLLRLRNNCFENHMLHANWPERFNELIIN